MNKTKVKKYAEGGETGDNPVAPKGYKPMTMQQRGDWNKFIQYINSKDVNMGGNPDLDNRDKSLGLKYFNDFAKTQKGYSITPADIPNIQYEFQYLQNKKALPDFTPTGDMAKLFTQYFPETRTVSDPD